MELDAGGITPDGAHPARAAAPIALVTEYYYPHLGGICRARPAFVAREARRYGHQVDIITSNIPERETELHVVRIGKVNRCTQMGPAARLTCGTGAEKRPASRIQSGQYVHHSRPLSLSPVLRGWPIEKADCPVWDVPHLFRPVVLLYDGNRYFQKRLDKFDAQLRFRIQRRSRSTDTSRRTGLIVPNGIEPTYSTRTFPAPAH